MESWLLDQESWSHNLFQVYHTQTFQLELSQIATQNT